MKIDYTQEISKCRVRSDKNERINHIIDKISRYW